jgi:hypothetical protein
MWEKIKKILQKEGGKCIIIEKDQSIYLVMKLEDYGEGPTSDNNPSEIEKVNRDIAEWKAKEGTQIAEVDENQEIKIEDLPF